MSKFMGALMVVLLVGCARQATRTPSSKTHHFVCNSWVQYDQRKQSYVPISPGACNKYKCRSLQVAVSGGGGGDGYTATINEKAERLAFVPPTDADFDGYLYNGPHYQFWVSDDGSLTRLTFLGSNPAIGAECK